MQRVCNTTNSIGDGVRLCRGGLLTQDCEIVYSLFLENTVFNCILHIYYLFLFLLNPLLMMHETIATVLSQRYIGNKIDFKLEIRLVFQLFYSF